MGAVVGSLYSAGYPMDQLWELGRRATFSYATRDFNKIGMLKLILHDKLMSSDEMENFITERIGDITFEQLKIPFSCVAMDIRTGETIVFREGPLAIAVRSSMNLPGIFKPVEYRHRYLVDGGVTDNLPVNAAKALGMDWVLASNTPSDISDSGLHNILTYLLQVMENTRRTAVGTIHKRSRFCRHAESLPHQNDGIQQKLSGRRTGTGGNLPPPSKSQREPAVALF